MSTLHSFRIVRKTETPSTMEDARQLLSSGSGGNVVCTAASQSRGRGRVPGRIWVDDGRGDLLFTAIIRKDRVRTGYPLTQLMALILCRHLESSHGLSPEIKWPNDVYVGGGKISGILVETEGDYYLAGMGLNLQMRVFPSDLRSPATSLVQALGLSGESDTAIPEVVNELEGILIELERGLEEPPPVTEVIKRLFGLGQPANVILGDPSRMQVVQGVISGLKEDGALLLNTGENEFLPVYSGEIR